MGANPVLKFSMEFVKYGLGLSNMGAIQYGIVKVDVVNDLEFVSFINMGEIFPIFDKSQ